MRFPSLTSALLSAALLFAAPAAFCAPHHTPQLFPTHPAKAPQNLASRRDTLNEIFSAVWQNYLSQHPEFASTIGEKDWNSQLTNHSVNAYNQQIASAGQSIFRFAAVSTKGMSAQEVLSRDLMVNWLLQTQEASQFSPWQMPVNPYTSLQVSLPRLVPQLSFASQKDYDDYIVRLTSVPAAFQHITDDCMLGMADNRVPPQFVLQQVLDQVNALLALKPEDSPFALPLQHFPASIPATDQKSIRQSVLTAIEKQVYPAYKSFARFLQRTYIPSGRTQAGLWSLPGGDAYYAFLVQQNTNSTLTPDLIHQLALRQVTQDEAAQLALAQKLGFPSLAALRAAIAANPKLHPASAQALLDAYRSALDRHRALLPSLFTFTRTPPIPVAVEALPAWMTPVRLSPSQAVASIPGTLYVNTADWQHRSLISVPSTACQEGLPGRQFQLAAARELAGLPAFRRYLPVPAYANGWSLYAAQLCQQTGPDQDSYSAFGALQTDKFYAIAAVVDTGINADHWTRQQATDYVRLHSGLSPAAISNLISRCVALPAQALSYTVGELKFLQLRSQAQAKLGSKFDLRAFNNQLIASGPLPLDTLTTRIDAWLSAQLPPAARQPAQ